jgi:DNA-binding NtrC family response regulator
MENDMIHSTGNQEQGRAEDFSKIEKASVRTGKLPDAVHELEKRMIQEAMTRSGGNQRLASEILGITERMLGYRLKHYGLKTFV